MPARRSLLTIRYERGQDGQALTDAGEITQPLANPLGTATRPERTHQQMRIAVKSGQSKGKGREERTNGTINSDWVSPSPSRPRPSSNPDRRLCYSLSHRRHHRSSFWPPGQHKLCAQRGGETAWRRKKIVPRKSTYRARPFLLENLKPPFQLFKYMYCTNHNLAFSESGKNPWSSPVLTHKRRGDEETLTLRMRECISDEGNISLSRIGAVPGGGHDFLGCEPESKPGGRAGRA